MELVPCPNHRQRNKVRSTILDTSPENRSFLLSSIEFMVIVVSTIARPLIPLFTFYHSHHPRSSCDIF